MLLTPFRSALLLAFLFAIGVPTVSAQRNFVDGYVVIRSNDTLKGQIDFRDWGTNPDHIFFRKGETAKAEEYRPLDLVAFGAGGHHYDSYTVHIAPYSSQPERLSSQEDIGAPYDTTVFLQVLTRGKLTLWEDRTGGGTDYYFVNGASGKPEQLLVITRISTTEGATTGFRQLAVFHDQLNGLMQDCETMRSRIMRSEYKGASLEKLFFAYNNCGKDTVEKRGSAGSVQIFPMVGFVSTAMKFTGYDAAAYQHYTGSSSIAAGAGALFIVPRNRQQLSFVADIAWQHVHSESDSVAETNYLSEAGHIDYSLLKLDILFRYRYPSGAVRPFLEGGMSNGVALGMNCYQGATNSLDNSHSTATMFDGSLRKHQEGWVLGAGLSGKRWTVEGRYEASTGISEVIDIGSPVKSWYVLVSYAL